MVGNWLFENIGLKKSFLWFAKEYKRQNMTC